MALAININDLLNKQKNRIQSNRIQKGLESSEHIPQRMCVRQ